MDKERILEKLIDKTHVSLEEGREALQRCNWNILDAVLILEDEGKIKKPYVSIYYTNEPYRKIKRNKIVKTEYEKERTKGIFQQLIEFICSFIDMCNNIFFKVIRNNKVLIKFPLTVIILFLIFAFWVIVPLVIIGFLFDIEYRFEGRNMEKSGINKVSKKISDEVQRVKRNKRCRRYD